MKRIRKTGLNRKTKSIIKQLREINRTILLDVMASVLDNNSLNKYIGDDISYEEKMLFLVGLFDKEHSIANTILTDMIKINNQYVEEFKNYSLEELEKEYSKDIIPAYHKIISISPAMMLFYYITNGLEKDDRFYHAIEFEKIKLEKAIDFKNNYEKKINLTGLENSFFEVELNEYYSGNIKNVGSIMSDEYLYELAQKYNGTISGENITINSRILSFYDSRAGELLRFLQHIDTATDLVLVNYKKAVGALDKAKDIIEIFNKMDNIQKENFSLVNENKFLKEKLEQASIDTNNEDLMKLEKENYYLHSQIEKMKLENEELLQTIRELKEVVDDLPISIDKIEPENTYDGESIVIVGGYWNSISKSEVRKDYLADFIEAEDVIKYTDRIRNYDIIIFDTSRNSHINYNRFKGNCKLKLISKSKKDSIDNLFIKQ